MKKNISLWMLFACIYTSTLYASCGSATCPVLSYTPFSGKTFEIGFQYEKIDQDQVYVGHKKSTVGAISGHHDEVETLNQQYVINAAYQLNSEWRIRAEVPFIHRKHDHVHHHHGEVIPGTWDISGLGDTTVFLDHKMGDLGLSAGVKLATGKTRLTNEEDEEAEVPIQPGTGSTDYSLGIFYQFGMANLQNMDHTHVQLPLKLGVSYTISGKGTDAWRFGNKWIANVGTHYLLTNSFALSADIQAKFQEKSDTGTTGEPASNTGGTWVYATPGVHYTLSEAVKLESIVQIPIYQNVNGIQLTAPYNLRIGIVINL